MWKKGARVISVALVSLPGISTAAQAAGRGQGAIVNQDSVPVYGSETASNPVVLLNRGKAVGAISGNILFKPDYRFDEKEGRVRINYFATADDRGKFQLGWIEPGFLTKFTYTCDCGGDEDDCSPFDTRGLKLSFAWNVCFQEARDAKLEQLLASEPLRTDETPGASLPRSATAIVGGAAVSTYQTPPSAAGTDCARHFSVKGSMIRGTTFSAHADVTSLTPEAAIDRLTEVLPQRMVTVVSADRIGGSVAATGEAGSGRQYPLQFAVTVLAEGVRVSGTVKLPIGLGAQDEVMRDELCHILTSLGLPGGGGVVAAATGTTPEVVPSGAASRPLPATGDMVEERLRKLDELRAKGLISREEYDKKRAEILSDL